MPTRGCLRSLDPAYLELVAPLAHRNRRAGTTGHLRGAPGWTDPNARPTVTKWNGVRSPYGSRRAGWGTSGTSAPIEPTRPRSRSDSTAVVKRRHGWRSSIGDG